jgi:phospholipase C
VSVSRRRLLPTILAGSIVLASIVTGATGAAPQILISTPIQHVVVIYQENHSFNEVLGWLCTQNPGRCLGTKTGKLSNGTTITLQQAPDVPPVIAHTASSQTQAIDGGKMDGFDKIAGCQATKGYACYDRYLKGNIPNLGSLASTYAISDHTFESAAVPSWGAHIELVASKLDGFLGNNPKIVAGNPSGPGWGCDSFRDAKWRPKAGVPYQWVPACIPTSTGIGPYRASPVKWVPTIMDRLDAAGRSWHIYAPGASDPGQLTYGYGWAICPTFAECLDGPGAASVSPSTQVVADAQAGSLPNLSIVIPSSANSQHNGYSMTQGDNWISNVVNAVMQGPDWSSTAIFITYDDCGCFYDEVAPPRGLGIRVPMVIVSPYAKPAFTDTSVASFASLLAFTEHVFGLQPLGTADTNAYDYMNAFNFAQTPLPPIHLQPHPVPPSSRAWIKAHPPPANDPT